MMSCLHLSIVLCNHLPPPLLDGNIHIQKLDTCTVQVPVDFTYFEGQQCSQDMICHI